MIKKAFEIKEFLSEDELVFIENIQKKLKKTFNVGDTKKAYTNGFDYNIIKKIVEPKLKKYFESYGVTDCMILEEFIPWVIHTDYVKGDDKPYYACLIPLSFEDKVTHTIVFNETATTMNWEQQLPDIDYEFDEHTKALLDHCSPEQLKKVSLYGSYQWQRGKLIAWDRKLLHTSDNFSKAGIKIKNALVIFLNLKDENR